MEICATDPIMPSTTVYGSYDFFAGDPYQPGMVTFRESSGRFNAFAGEVNGGKGGDTRGGATQDKQSDKNKKDPCNTLAAGLKRSLSNYNSALQSANAMQSELSAITYAHYAQNDAAWVATLASLGRVGLAGVLPRLTGFYGLGTSAAAVGRTSVTLGLRTTSGAVVPFLEGEVPTVGTTVLTSPLTTGTLTASRWAVNGFWRMDPILQKDAAAVFQALDSASSAMQVNLNLARAISEAMAQAGCK